MDEFCANKDSQLKRCACSSRVNEFDKTREQLSNIEDKMLDFNQRLLTVNMDREDAAALFQATEGELAFAQDDRSESKKMLDEIAKKLNTSFDDSNFDQNLNAISLSLNMDSAFDTVDSLSGASTTTKTGTALYSAALPICREMAAEVCSADELDIAASGYQMAIEQDCNTVAKSYQTQTDKAREKIREGSALLDMSRLDIYQKRNSDDILTCKSKMLEMLSDTTVCGDNLGKCLDTTGRYINPSTGAAFLTTELPQLANLISRPDADKSWTTDPDNKSFVAFLNTKKKFLEPAMENCQDISDKVWDDFMEDALAQIKLAQESKLEEVRQSCTTLTTQCLSDAADSLEEFDARALSTFGVTADKTVNAMCSEIQTACNAVLQTSGGTEWTTGMAGIATDKTYETILQTCREVGRACIIQTCKSISGNFGLCENIQTSVNRKSIINRSACWAEVQNCVAAAGTTAIDNIIESLIASDMMADQNETNPKTFYKYLYGYDPTVSNVSHANTDVSYIYDNCYADCITNRNDRCNTCRLTERIWGNCEFEPTTDITDADSHNKILMPQSDSGVDTLMSWFATNTGTSNAVDSCRDTSCGVGLIGVDDGTGNIACVTTTDLMDDKQLCPIDDQKMNIFNDNSVTNCCKSGRDWSGKCCMNGSDGVYNFTAQNYDTFWHNQDNLNTTNDLEICIPANSNTPQFVLSVSGIGDNTTDTYYESGRYYLFCLGSITTTTEPDTVYCNGQYIFVKSAQQINNQVGGQYILPNYTNTVTPTHTPRNYYQTDYAANTYEWNQSSKSWATNPNTTATPSTWKVSYESGRQ